MFADILPLAIGIAVLLFCAYLLIRAYRPSWLYSQRDSFVVRPPPMGPPVAAPINLPVQPIPAPAPPVKVDPPEEERVVAPAGPGAPNAAPPVETPASISPEAKPVDPYDDRNMEAPIEDSMRHPELSFGPGIENNGMNRLATSGVASARVASSESPFSPDFAQNGGKFMGDVTANDLTKDDRFASF
jgi:hypothetical protein